MRTNTAFARAVRTLVFALALAVAFVAPATLGASPAQADPLGKTDPPKPSRVSDVPCAGCRASLPPGTDPVPLLVVLHGDYGHEPDELRRAWEKHAAPRDVAVLVLRCPRELGCKGSYWQWNGDPSWITNQVDALAATRSIDRERVWLAGWSGGASYMGMHATELQRTFAALVYHGGGIPSGAGGCAAPANRGHGSSAERSDAAPAGSALFLVGDGNPLHALAVGLRRQHEACGDEVVWKLIARGDHTAEWSALDTNGAAIFDWLMAKRRVTTRP